MTATRIINIVETIITYERRARQLEVPVDATFDETEILKMKALFEQTGGHEDGPDATDHELQYSISESD